MPSVGFAIRHPILSFYLLTFGISWGLALAVYAPNWLKGTAITATVGLIIFPLILLGPFVSGLVLTRIVDGKTGLSDLWARMRRWRIGLAWFLVAAFLVPIVMIFVLEVLRLSYSPVYSPRLFLIGFFFGVPPGILEEVGWTGYLLPKFTRERSALESSLIIGPLWGLWHLPAIDFLGAAYPHGGDWIWFFLSFVAVVSAVRVLIVWNVTNTNSVLAAQVMHISLTGSLVLLSPSPIQPANEAAWYGVFAAALWGVALLVAAVYGRSLNVPTKANAGPPEQPLPNPH